MVDAQSSELIPWGESDVDEKFEELAPSTEES